MFFRALFLLLLISIHQTSCCLSCMEDSEEKFRKFKSFLNEQHEDVLEFYALKVKAVEMYKHLLSVLASQYADKHSMKQLDMDFKKTLDMIEHSELKGIPLFATMGVQFTRLEEKLNRTLKQQLTERFCPNLRGDNQCGIIEQSVTHCGSCKKEMNLCVGGPEYCRERISQCPMCLCDSEGKCHDMHNGRSCEPCPRYTECLSESLNCGTQDLVIEEREDIVFDCTLDWHLKVDNRLQYVFEKISSGKAKVLVTTDESTLEKKFASKSDEGEYRCTARLMNTVPVSILTYKVKIIPSRIMLYKTKPTLPPEEITTTPKPTGLTMEEKVTYGSIILVVVSGFLLLTFFVSVYMYRKRHNQDQEDQEDQEKQQKGKRLEEMMQMLD